MAKKWDIFIVWLLVVLILVVLGILYERVGKDWFGTMKKTTVPTYKEPILKERLKTLGVEMGEKVFLRIFKEERMLEAWVKTGGAFSLLKSYPICAYSGDLGPKLKEGDKQAPEGFYRVYKGSLNPNSQYHLSFNLGFPNKYDKAYERTGSYLMVHGSCVSIGCYAMTDAKIEEIYGLVEAALNAGQGYVPVHIFPFRLSEERLLSYEAHQWFDFWGNLKEGYDYFELEKRPPVVKAVDKRYEVYESEL